MTQARYFCSIGKLPWILVCMNTYEWLGSLIIGTSDESLEQLSQPFWKSRISYISRWRCTLCPHPNNRFFLVVSLSAGFGVYWNFLYFNSLFGLLLLAYIRVYSDAKSSFRVLHTQSLLTIARSFSNEKCLALLHVPRSRPSSSYLVLITPKHTSNLSAPFSNVHPSQPLPSPSLALATKQPLQATEMTSAQFAQHLKDWWKTKAKTSCWRLTRWVACQDVRLSQALKRAGG